MSVVAACGIDLGTDTAVIACCKKGGVGSLDNEVRAFQQRQTFWFKGLKGSLPPAAEGTTHSRPPLRACGVAPPLLMCAMLGSNLQCRRTRRLHIRWQPLIVLILNTGAALPPGLEPAHAVVHRLRRQGAPSWHSPHNHCARALLEARAHSNCTMRNIRTRARLTHSGRYIRKLVQGDSCARLA